MKDREDQIALLTDMLNSSINQHKMKESELERLQKKMRTFKSVAGTEGFKSFNNLGMPDKQNRTENTFLPKGLKSSIRPEAGYPFASTNRADTVSNEGGLPSVKGAKNYGSEISSKHFEDVSQKSTSQISLAISQKRGDKIVQENRKKLEQMKGEPRKSTRVSNIEPLRGSSGINLNAIQTESQEEMYQQETYQQEMTEQMQDEEYQDPGENNGESDFEEGQPDDYELNEY